MQTGRAEGEGESQVDLGVITKCDAGLYPTALRSQPSLKPRVSHLTDCTTRHHWQFLIKLNKLGLFIQSSRYAPRCLSSCVEKLYLHKNLSMSVCSCFIHNYQNFEATKISFMVNGQIMVLSYNGILLSKEEEMTHQTTQKNEGTYIFLHSILLCIYIRRQCMNTI